MSPQDKTLLILGVILFAILAIGLIVLLAKGGKIGVLLPFFLLPIGMIGFSEISTLKAPGVEIDKETVAKFADTGGSGTSAENLSASLNVAGEALNRGKALSPAARANLENMVNKLGPRRTTLPLQSQVVLAHAQLLLGSTNEALQSLQYATNAASRAHTKLAINPQLERLLQTKVR